MRREQHASTDLRPGAPAPAATPALTVRVALEGDVEGIVAVEIASFADPRERFGPRKVRYLVRSRRALVQVAVAGGGPVGWVAGFTSPPGPRPWGRVYALAVQPAVRKMKLGTILLEGMVEALGSRGAGRTFLEVRVDNAAALRLYRKLGFVACRSLPDYYGPGLHAQRMVREAKSESPGGKSE